MLNAYYTTGPFLGYKVVDGYISAGGVDANHAADQLLNAAKDCGWITDDGFRPTPSQAAFAGLEGRRTDKKGKPSYSYPCEHQWSLNRDNAEAVAFAKSTGPVVEWLRAQVKPVVTESAAPAQAERW